MVWRMASEGLVTVSLLRSIVGFDDRVIGSLNEIFCYQQSLNRQ
jgi:hypothetical protein